MSHFLIFSSGQLSSIYDSVLYRLYACLRIVSIKAEIDHCVRRLAEKLRSRKLNPD